MGTLMNNRTKVAMVTVGLLVSVVGHAEPAQPPAPPTPQALKIDLAVWRFLNKNPGKDWQEPIARQHGLSRDRVAQLVNAVGAYRQALADEARRTSWEILGRVDAKAVQRTELGAYTAIVALFVNGCPGDDDLDAEVKARVLQLAPKMPAGIDSYKAAVWSRGLMCGERSYCNATWVRKTGKVTLLN